MIPRLIFLLEYCSFYSIVVFGYYSEYFKKLLIIPFYVIGAFSVATLKNNSIFLVSIYRLLHLGKKKSLVIYPFDVSRYLNDGRTLVKCFHNFEDDFQTVSQYY